MQQKGWLIVAVGIMIGIFVLTGCGIQPAANAEKGNSAAEKQELYVSAAASLTDVMKELAADYKKENPNSHIIFNFGSSGALQQAIENGGTTDIFFSAATKQMDALDKAGELAPDTRRDLLVNEVVLIVPKGNAKQVQSFEDLNTGKVQKIALGEPKGVPVGQYSEEILKNLNLLDSIKPKVVYGSDVRQVLSWVESGDADCGIVYATDAAISSDVDVVAKAPNGSHKPVVYPAAILKSAKNTAEAEKFMKFIMSDSSKKVFEKYGFEVK